MIKRLNEIIEKLRMFGLIEKHETENSYKITNLFKNRFAEALVVICERDKQKKANADPEMRIHSALALSLWDRRDELTGIKTEDVEDMAFVLSIFIKDQMQTLENITKVL